MGISTDFLTYEDSVCDKDNHNVFEYVGGDDETVALYSVEQENDDEDSLVIHKVSGKVIKTAS